MLLLVGGWKRQYNKRNAGVLRSYRGSCLTASKEWGPESFNHMKLSCLLLLLLFCFFWLQSVACRTFLTRDCLGFFPNDARKNYPFVLSAFTGWSSERCPGIGFLSRGADVLEWIAISFSRGSS